MTHAVYTTILHEPVTFP